MEHASEEDMMAEVDDVEEDRQNRPKKSKKKAKKSSKKAKKAKKVKKAKKAKQAEQESMEEEDDMPEVLCEMQDMVKHSLIQNGDGKMDVVQEYCSLDEQQRAMVRNAIRPLSYWKCMKEMKDVSCASMLLKLLDHMADMSCDANPTDMMDGNSPNMMDGNSPDMMEPMKK